jgi:S1-C subfamily serine protease
MDILSINGGKSAQIHTILPRGKAYLIGLKEGDIILFAT